MAGDVCGGRAYNSRPRRAPSRAVAQKFFHRLFMAKGGVLSSSGGSLMYMKRGVKNRREVGGEV